MELSEVTLDITDRVEEIEARLEEIETEKAEIETEAQAVVEEEDLDEVPDDLSQEWGDLDREEAALNGELSKFENAIEQWSGTEFIVSELTFGQLQAVSDDMMEKSFEVDVETQDVEGTPRQGFYQIELLKEAIVDWPEGAPVTERRNVEKPSPGDYPIPVGEWLFEKVDNLNTRGDTEVGNSSLGEAIDLGR